MPHRRPGMSGNDWLGIPVATIGGYLTYRKSAVDKAGFKEFPKDFPGFLELCKKLKADNPPAGFALGHATGDANAWLHWILWGDGAYTVDKDDKVIINSAETAEGAGLLQAAFRPLHSRHRILERRLEQQGVPGRRVVLHRQRHLDLRRRERRSQDEGSCRGYLPRAVAGGPGRQADRVAALPCRSWHSTSRNIRTQQRPSSPSCWRRKTTKNG